MTNIRFNYLYRDAENYKNGASVTFSNADEFALEEISGLLKSKFWTDGLFIADQIRVPEAFLYINGQATSDDHCFHEFDSVVMTSDFPDDRHHRSISDFLDEVVKASSRGWKVFDPHDPFLAYYKVSKPS